MSETDEQIRVNANTFQAPLAHLAETMVQKVFREGVSYCAWPACVSDDVSMMLRYSVPFTICCFM
jgi:hypothetical protein